MTLEEICSRVESFIAVPDPAAIAFDELAADVFAFQYEQNAAYRAFCRARGVEPATITSGDDIPPIITRAFKDLEFSVLPPDLRTRVFHSSGTTGHRPSRHFYGHATLRLYELSLRRWFHPHVLPNGERVDFIILTPPAPEAPHSSLVHMFETTASAFSASAPVFGGMVAADQTWELDFDAIVANAQGLIAARRPVVVCGTAFSFVHLCDFLTQSDLVLTLPPGSRVFETGGYKGRSRSIPKAGLYELIATRLSVPDTHVISEYGMSELSSQAYDRVFGNAEERIFRFPPWVRASIRCPETGQPVREGETGLLRVLDLANVGSVMAIQTEDLARQRGAGFELAGRAAMSEPRGCSLMQVAS